MSIKFNFFEAGHGDSILVSTEDTHILIDGGVYGTYEEEIEDKIDDIETLDLMILTHIDNDHICGLIEMLTEDENNRKKIKEIWFNSFHDTSVDVNNREIAYGQGILFDKLIEKYMDCRHRKDIFLKKNNIYKINNDIELILISPEEEQLKEQRKKWKNNKKMRLCNGREAEEIAGKSCIDNRSISNLIDNSYKQKYCNSIANKTSISFILKHKGRKFLFLADADIRVINNSLIDMGYSSDNRLHVDFIKLSHHGSVKNINDEFLSLVKTDTFITLTDCSRYRHPDKETFSMILNHKKRADDIKFIFNYQNIVEKKFPKNNKNKEEKKYNFKAYYQSEISY